MLPVRDQSLAKEKIFYEEHQAKLHNSRYGFSLRIPTS